MKNYLLALASLLLCVTLNAPAAVYKWFDADGTVQYSDQPNNSSARKVPLKSAPPPDTSVQQRQERQNKLLDVMEDERKTRDNERAEAKLKQEQREKECALARVRLKNYERAQYLYVEEEADKRAILSEEERKAAMDEAKQAVENLCDEP